MGVWETELAGKEWRIYLMQRDDTQRKKFKGLRSGDERTNEKGFKWLNDCL